VTRGVLDVDGRRQVKTTHLGSEFFM